MKHKREIHLDVFSNFQSFQTIFISSSPIISAIEGLLKAVFGGKHTKLPREEYFRKSTFLLNLLLVAMLFRWKMIFGNGG